MRNALPPALAGLAILAATADLAAAQPAHVRFLEAKTVAIVYDADGRFLPERELRASMDVTAAERESLAAVRAAFEGWGRYTITEPPWDADLIVAVRVGRLAEVTVAASIGGPTPRRGVESRSADLGVGTPWDVLSVYDAAMGGEPRALLWSRQQKQGLAAESPALFAHFRRMVEGAPRQP